MELTIDCRNGMSAIHTQLAEALRFPAWYGSNLDALHDCLTELSQDVTFTVLWPEFLPGLKRVLIDSAEDNPHLTLILT